MNGSNTMLINTVIFLLRDALPVAILLGFMLAMFPLSNQRLSYIIALTFFIAVVLVANRMAISDWFDGTGYEWLTIILLVFSYACLLIVSWRSFLRPSLALVFIAALLSSLHLADFVLYLYAFGSQAEQLTPVIIGSVLGLGICASISLLFFILLAPYRQHLILHYLFIIFITSHCAEFIIQLQQIGVLDEYSLVWDFSSYINDESEYGHLLNALFGYQSRPQMPYLLTWIVLVTSACSVKFLSTRQRLFASWRRKSL
jgi:high-affinity iron transporter